MAVQVLTTRPEVVTAAGVVRIREVVTRVPHPLILMPGIVLVRRNRESGEGDTRRSDRDAVGLLPVIRPRREVAIRATEHRLAYFHLIDGAVAEYRRQLPEPLMVVFAVGAGRTGEAGVAGAERLKDDRARVLAHQPRPGRHLIVQTNAALFLRVLARQRNVERRIRRVENAGPRFALVLVVAEVVQLVSDDRAAERRAVLLVVDRFDDAQHGVFGVHPLAISEIAAEQTRHLVAA